MPLSGEPVTRHQYYLRHRSGVAVVDLATAVVAGGVVGVAHPEAPTRVRSGGVHGADAAERGVAPVVGVDESTADHQLVDAGDVGAVRGTLVLHADRHGGVGPTGPRRADVVVAALGVARVTLDVHPHGHTVVGRQRARRRRQRQRVVRGVDVVRTVAGASGHVQRAACGERRHLDPEDSCDDRKQACGRRAQDFLTHVELSSCWACCFFWAAFLNYTTATV